MKTALIAGPTGLVGQALLSFLLESNHYEKVIALIRRPLNNEHPKLIEQIIDFEQLENLRTEHTVDDAFCCLGTTIKNAGSKEAFTKVDYTYVIQLANWAERNNCRSFSVISSVGANSHTTNFYLQTKGHMEEAVSKLSIPSMHLFRPSLLLGDRNEFRLAEKLSEKIMYLFNPLLIGRFQKYRAIKATQVAQAMHNKAQEDIKGVRIYEGKEIR
ncbi:oxidoreductase [Carboxylicivirga marina]|uniref:Oxidoreductase n=1 Tax=Carboxylicivirga marina TaxID=2800988 RepID=A0ABS1HHM9_9BACT|nr:oxidoreductase [Carboxylicivirga marina]MBK3517167.1 oxidoreductase [Carboxylicivirga marina]